MLQAMRVEKREDFIDKKITAAETHTERAVQKWPTHERNICTHCQGTLPRADSRLVRALSISFSGPRCRSLSSHFLRRRISQSLSPARVYCRGRRQRQTNCQARRPSLRLEPRAFAASSRRGGKLSGPRERQTYFLLASFACSLDRDWTAARTVRRSRR